MALERGGGAGKVVGEGKQRFREERASSGQVLHGCE